MIVTIPSIEDVRLAESVIRKHLSPVPLIRSYALENILGFDASRRVWLKDYGWTPVGSFKLLGALNWVDNNLEAIGDRPIAAHSSGNFACGISFAGMRYDKRVLIVMPDSAPQVKFEMAKSFGAEIITYDITRDHETGERDQITRQLTTNEGAIQASPYDDRFVIAGNGVGGLEIVDELRNSDRTVSHFLCQVSGGGLMAGHALAIHDGFSTAQIIGVEPDGADDFRQSLQSGQRTRIDRPTGICDGLLSYDVGEHNWPILKERCTDSVAVPDHETRLAMRWLFDNHGLRTEPSGAITIAAVLQDRVNLEGDGDIVIVVSGRNVDPEQFHEWIDV